MIGGSYPIERQKVFILSSPTLTPIKGGGDNPLISREILMTLCHGCAKTTEGTDVKHFTR
jgi:hypothetical protein